jgi:hypothetical protein
MWFIFITACLFDDTLLTPRPRGLSANVLLRREQSNSACGTSTHIDAGFTSARSRGAVWSALAEYVAPNGARSVFCRFSTTIPLLRSSKDWQSRPLNADACVRQFVCFVPTGLASFWTRNPGLRGLHPAPPWAVECGAFSHEGPAFPPLICVNPR